MATNAGPIYGKQYIRYAETWEAAVDTEAGVVGTVEIGELRAVAYATYAGPGIACTPGDLLAFTGEIAGINQAYMPSALAQPYTARQLTVATSGLLLVEVDPASPAINFNSPLNVNSLGQATAVPGPVSLDGTTPIIREIVTIGGRRLALVSFA